MSKLWLVIVVVFVSACGEDATEADVNDASGDSSAQAPLSPTFSAIQTDMFSKSCAFGSCHDSQQPAGGLDLSEGNAYAALVGVAASASEADGALLVEAGKPAASYLVQRLEGTTAADQMPPNGAAMSADQIAQVKQWITDGAKQ